MPWTKLAALSDLPPGSLIEVERGAGEQGAGERYALCNVGGEVRALAGDCPHQGGPLGEGSLDGDLIACPWHMWEFDSSTGICRLDPSLSISTYPVKIEDGDILVQLA